MPAQSQSETNPRQADFEPAGSTYLLHLLLGPTGAVRIERGHDHNQQVVRPETGKVNLISQTWLGEVVSRTQTDIKHKYPLRFFHFKYLECFLCVFCIQFPLIKKCSPTCEV